VLEGGAGDDSLDGGAGTADIAVFADARAHYVGFLLDGALTVQHAQDGSDTLTGIEVLRFADGDVSVADFIAQISVDGDDTLVGTEGADSLRGFGGNDTLSGLGGNDTLRGDDGDDLLDGGAGADAMAGGAGNDSYVVDNAGDTVTEAAGGGHDIVTASISATLAAEAEELWLTGGALDGTGNAGANRLVGTAAANRLDGAGGADLMEGGLGDDIYVIDHAGDAAVEAAGGGTDTVLASVAATLGEALENLVLTGAAALSGTGNALANRITGNAAANVLAGGEGDDILTGGGGADTIDGGAGAADVAVFAGSFAAYGFARSGAVFTVSGGADGPDQVQGVEIFRFADGDRSAFEIASKLPTQQDDWLVGTAGEDEIDALAGHDTVEGLGGKDYLKGGAGNDHMMGGADEDKLEGGDGADTLDGGAGKDDMAGGAGDDTYILDSAEDVVIENSGEGFDTVRAGFSYTLANDAVEAVLLTGTAAIDATGTPFANALTGNAAANRLDGREGNDTLSGGDGNDTLTGDQGNDSLDGGAGTGDVAVFSGDRGDYALSVSHGVFTVSGGGDGTDMVAGVEIFRFADGDIAAQALLAALPTEGDDVLTGTAGADILAGAGGNDTLDGQAGNDSLSGDAGDDTLRGGAGTDTLAGGAGADLLDGGTGNDAMNGGAGDDVFIVDAGGDTVSEAAAGGSDTVRASVSHTLASHVEMLVLTGTAAINGTGNTLSNTITGNAAANTLNGGSGADVLDGGEGNDSYVIDNAGDMILDSGGWDSVQSIIAFVLPDGLEKLTLTGSAGLAGTGNAADNELVGNSGANALSGGLGNDLLNGGGGNDAMAGGGGDDLYIVAQSGDTVIESAGEGFDTVESSVAHTLAAHVEKLVLTGSSGLAGTGNAAANTIHGNSGGNVLSGRDGDDWLAGNAGNDTLNGEAGADTLVGGAGTDRLTGGAGADMFVFARNEGLDTVLDFALAEDLIGISATSFGSRLVPGALDPARLAFGSAIGPGGQFVYTAATGVLAWDNDGAGGASAATVATFSTRPALSAADFVVLG
jgi:Ca2+-binding RTX toxin-like protein